MNAETMHETGENEFYHEQENVNGVDIKISKNNVFDRYEISFPQIPSDSEVLKATGVRSQKILLTDKEALAKDIFDFAVNEARLVVEGDAEAVWETVWNHLKDYRPAEHKKAA